MKNEKFELCLNEKENNEIISAIEETKQGKEEGFKKLYDSTYKFVYSRAKMLCGSEQETSDIVQEVYISVYRGINTLKSNESLFSWLKTIIFHTGGRIMKKKGNEILLSEESEEAFESLLDETEQTEQNFIDKQDIEIIRSCIDKLSDEQRAVILAYYYDNLKVEEIAELLSVSVGTVKSRLFSARKKLKEYIEEEENRNGYKLHSFGATSLVFTLKSILQGNMVASKDKGTLLYNSICKKLKFHSENWIANALAKSNKTLKSRYKSLKMKVLTKAADMGSKKIILSTVVAVTAVSVISGTVAIVISNFNNDAITNHTYSESELSSAPLISSTTENTVSSEDDGSDISVFSLDESKTNSSSTSVTSSASTNSKVDSSENTVSTEKSNSTQTITENNPTTYFEKHNLKITPISNELCFNNDPNHQCPYDKDIGITVTSVPERFYYSFDVELFDDNFDISTYKAVKYYDYAVNSQKWEDCHMSDVVSFDKYSGKTIDNGTLTKYGWQELIFNDKKIYVMMFNGVDESGYWHIILCPVEYDGAIFAVLGEDKDFGYITSNNCLIEKFIDLKNDKYYLFAEKS